MAYILGHISVKQRQSPDQQVDSGPRVVQLCENNGLLVETGRVKQGSHQTGINWQIWPFFTKKKSPSFCDKFVTNCSLIEEMWCDCEIDATSL